MLKKTLIALGSVLVLLVLLGICLPEEYSLERSIVIDAEPSAIHALVGDLERWDEWAPWKEDDPSIVTTFGERTRGVGASQTWIGREGDGELSFTAADPARGIEYDMAFIQGETRMPSHASILYRSLEEGGTEVRWAMEGAMPGPVIGGYFALLLDSMAGPMFVAGLEKLKLVVERPAAE